MSRTTKAADEVGKTAYTFSGKPATVTAYDKTGNIKALQRYGTSLIDNLTYTYNGNQLTRVEDATGNTEGLSSGASTENDTLKRVVIN